jgi:hypothetical protein
MKTERDHGPGERLALATAGLLSLNRHTTLNDHNPKSGDD